SHLLCFFFTVPPTTEIYPLSLHDALPICRQPDRGRSAEMRRGLLADPAVMRHQRSQRDERGPDENEQQLYPEVHRHAPRGTSRCWFASMRSRRSDRRRSSSSSFVNTTFRSLSADSFDLAVASRRRNASLCRSTSALSA